LSELFATRASPEEKSKSKNPLSCDALFISFDHLDELNSWIEELRPYQIKKLILEDRTLDSQTRISAYWDSTEGRQRTIETAELFEDVFANEFSTLEILKTRRCGWVLYASEIGQFLKHLEIGDVPEWGGYAFMKGQSWEEDVEYWVDLVRNCDTLVLDRVPDTVTRWVPNIGTRIEFIDMIETDPEEKEREEEKLAELKQEEVSEGEEEASEGDEEGTEEEEESDEEEAVAESIDPRDYDEVYLPGEEILYKSQAHEATSSVELLFNQENSNKRTHLTHINLVDSWPVTESFLYSFDLLTERVYISTDDADHVQRSLEQAGRFRKLHIMISGHVLQSDVVRTINSAKWNIGDLEQLVIQHEEVDVNDAERVLKRLESVLYQS